MTLDRLDDLEQRAAGDRAARAELARQLRRRNDVRGELLEATLAKPTRASWRAVLERLAREPPDHHPVLAAWAAPWLRYWPDAMREVPFDWLDALGSDSPPAQLAALCRVLLLHERPSTAAALASPHLAGIVTVRHGGPSGVAPPDIAQALAAAPFLGRVRRLDLRAWTLSSADLAALARGRRLDGLEWLALRNLSLAEVVALVRTARPQRLHTLWLHGSPCTPEVLAALRRAGWLRGLRRLRLSRCALGDDGAAALAACADLERLETLELDAEGLSCDGATALARSAHLSRLQRLVLRANLIGTRGLVALLGSTTLRSLRRLELDENRVRDPSALTGVSLRARAPALEVLELDRNPLGDDFVAALAASPHLHGLRALGLAHVRVGPSAAAALASSPWLRALRRLDLRGDVFARSNAVGDDGAVALARSAAMAQLRHLILSHNGLGERGVEALASSATLTRLARLELHGCAVGERSMAALQAWRAQRRSRGVRY